MAVRNNPFAWWGIIVAVAIVVGSGFYAKSNTEPDHTTPSAASNTPASTGQASLKWPASREITTSDPTYN
jgi:hypothetical protein